MHSSIVLLVLATLLLAGCAHGQYSQQEKDTITAEVGRLAQLAANHEIKEGDLGTLKQLLASDAGAQDHLEELELMVQYQEFEHAGHALSFLGDYASTSEHVLCPGHELAHYYVFMRHGAEHEAEHALDETQEQLPEWIPKAKAYAQEYPGGYDVDALAGAIQAHLDRIEQGDTAATDEEIRFLANDASVCVSEDSH
jgi:outer membrane murein-binding lipoprotein Lpp